MQGPLGAGRAIALVVAAWLGMSIVASFVAVLPMRILPGLRPGPDVAALVVLFVGLSGRGSTLTASLLAFAVGYLADLSAGSPKGLHVIAAVLLVLMARGVSQRLLVRGVIFTTFIAAVFCGAWLVLLALMRGALDPGGLRAFRGPLAKVPLSLLSTALFASPVFAVLHRIDRLFVRDPRALGGGAKGGGGGGGGRRASLLLGPS